MKTILKLEPMLWGIMFWITAIVALLLTLPLVIRREFRGRQRKKR